MILRPMVADDLEQVSEIYRSQVGRGPQPTWAAGLRALFEQPERSIAFVAEVEEELIGYVVGEVRIWEFGSEPAGWITGLCVRSDREGKGAARALLNRGAKGLRALGVEHIRTMVREDDVNVLRLFRSAGFVAGPYTELELSWEQ